MPWLCLLGQKIMSFFEFMFLHPLFMKNIYLSKVNIIIGHQFLLLIIYELEFSLSFLSGIS